MSIGKFAEGKTTVLETLEGLYAPPGNNQAIPSPVVFPTRDRLALQTTHKHVTLPGAGHQSIRIVPIGTEKGPVLLFLTNRKLSPP